MVNDPTDLERQADELLAQDFQDKRRNKTRVIEFPVLSPSQLKRRTSMEIPYSNLSNKQRLECRIKHLDYCLREDE